MFENVDIVGNLIDKHTSKTYTSMGASIFPGICLLMIYINEDITPDELTLLHKYMEEFPVLKEKFNEFSNPNKVKERIQLLYNFDKEAFWQKFKSKHVVEDIPDD